jgi:arsenate reductase
MEDEGIEAEIVEYLDQPPTVAALRVLMAQLGISDPRSMIRTGEQVYATLGLADRSGDDLLAAMVDHPILLERPIVVYRDRAVIARRPSGCSSCSVLDTAHSSTPVSP